MARLLGTGFPWQSETMQLYLHRRQCSFTSPPSRTLSPLSCPAHLQKATFHAQRAALQEHEAYTWDSDRLAAPSPLPPTLHGIHLTCNHKMHRNHLVAILAAAGCDPLHAPALVESDAMDQVDK